MTAIGTVIEQGDQIPEDVIGMFDNEGDPWFLVGDHWHGTAQGIRLCAAGRCPGTRDPLRYTPLTVGAVRS